MSFGEDVAEIYRDFQRGDEMAAAGLLGRAKPLAETEEEVASSV